MVLTARDRMMKLIDRINDAFENLLHAGRMAVRLHRAAHWCDRAGLPLLPCLIKQFNGLLCGAEIHYKARIGKDFAIAHPRGVVIGRNVEIGDYCACYSGVVIGVRTCGDPRQPRIGHRVIIYAGAKILGDITVGDDAVIAANAVVTDDVPAGAIMGGIPARVIGHRPVPEAHDDTRATTRATHAVTGNLH